MKSPLVRTGMTQALTSPETAAAMRPEAIALLGGLVLGYGVVVVSGVSNAVTSQLGFSEWQTGWEVSAPTLNAMFAIAVFSFIAIAALLPETRGRHLRRQDDACDLSCGTDRGISLWGGTRWH